MQAVASTANLPSVTENARGDAIQDRLDALGISDREFQNKTGIDRKTLKRAVEGHASVRPQTYLAIEAGLDRLEQENRGLPAEERPDDPGADLIEFRLSGNFGVDIVVKGPVRDRSELEDSVARLIREMRGDK